MYYYLSINGEIVSKPMSKAQAKIALGKLRGTIIGLEIVESDIKVAHIAAKKEKIKLTKRKK